MVFRERERERERKSRRYIVGAKVMWKEREMLGLDIVMTNWTMDYERDLPVVGNSFLSGRAA